MLRKLISLTLLFGTFVFLFSFSGEVCAQIGQSISYDADDVMSGSIISRNPQTGLFYLSREEASPNIFGVVVENPIINIRSTEDSNVSVLRTGTVKVNVVFTGESIEIGDYITTFGYDGLGVLADSSHQYVVGVALESFDQNKVEMEIIDNQERSLSVGKVLVDLQIGAREKDGEVPPLSEEGQGGPQTSFGNHLEHYLAMIARYVMSASVAVGALYFSYHFFKVNVSGGLSALGRNPMARQPIQKMMFFNMFLVILVSVGGLLLSALILLIPIVLNKLI